MNLKIYGICFQMRQGPDLLSYVQSGTPVPVDVMEQVMDQAGSLTQAEIAFAEQLDKDWKKAFNERIPLLMGISADGGYDITCTVPDELLKTTRLLTGLNDEKIVEEYTASYLKDVCGVEASIVSVDVEEREREAASAETGQGFDLNELGVMPEGPKFEDVSQFSGMDLDNMAAAVSEEIKGTAPKNAQPDMTEDSIPDLAEQFLDEELPPVELPDEKPAMDMSDLDEEMPQGQEESAYEKSGIPVEEGYPEEASFPDLEEIEIPDLSEEEEETGAEEIPAVSEEATEEPEEENEEQKMQNAIVSIYREFVNNIKDRRLDERLNLQFG